MSNISNDFSIPRRSFRRAVTSVGDDIREAQNMKWSEAAMELLQTVTEKEIIEVLDKSNRLANHAKRTGITAEDVRLACDICDIDMPKVCHVDSSEDSTQI